ncbi:MAG TPA: signal peptidase II [Tepidisphaeraceae bacterium]|nr:signal peptidase II [Tepidisphaeraceae bacterium]
MPRSSDFAITPAAIARFAVTTAAGLSLDLWSKAQAVVHLKNADPFDFIPGWLQFEYTENHGAVFGVAQGQRWVFLVVSFLALVFLTYLFSASGRRAFYQIILGMLLAGVLGNMYDRIAFGYVRDMIHALPMWPHFFPWIFNVADSLLCVGVGLMLVYSFFHSPPPSPSVPAEGRRPIEPRPHDERSPIVSENP